MTRLLRITRPGQPRTRGYLICSSPRSGSTYLAELLTSTGLLGVPREYFNVVGKWGQLDRNDPTNLGRLLDRVLKEGRTRNGIYAVKAHADHFAAISPVADPLTALPNLRFVRIRRRDTLGQAISWLRAHQTQHFRASTRPAINPTYSAAGIREFLRQIADQDARWDALLGRLACRPLNVAYEDLMSDPQRHVDRVAALMSVEGQTPIIERRVAITIQRDGLNEEWRQRFLAETGDEFCHLERSLVG